MNHVYHIQRNKQILDLRWQILKLMREFFWSQNFTEVETPILLRLPGQEPYLSPMKLKLHNEKGEEFTGFLHTSPEYTMKKMLAAGYEKIFSLGKVFRDYESFGGTHNPEFTMIEWYRTDADFTTLMDDVEQLFLFLYENLKARKHESTKNTKALGDSSILTSEAVEQFEQLEHFIHFERIHMRDLWKQYVGVNLDEYLDKEKMFELCVRKGFSPEPGEAYEDLFYRIFLNEVEPKLSTTAEGNPRGVIIHHYPKQMAALSRISKTDPGYAERIEVYINGLELANGFGELTDAEEQGERLAEEQALRSKLSKEVFAIDQEFVEAVGNMPPSAGIALGVDRLVQFFATQVFPDAQGCQNLDSVIGLPASKLFENPKS